MIFHRQKALGRVFPSEDGKINRNLFFRGYVHRKNTSGARQCGIGSPSDPIVHTAGCILLEKMLAFLRSVSNFFDTLNTIRGSISRGLCCYISFKISCFRRPMIRFSSRDM